MTSESDVQATQKSCANRGAAAIDDMTLKLCDSGDLVSHFNDACQEDHPEEHKAECEKRARELRDELLFKQPESCCVGDCPICCLPMPQDDSNEWQLHACCCTVICNACFHANRAREDERGLKRKCPFCRKPPPKTTKEVDKYLMDRAAKDDPLALRKIGLDKYLRGGDEDFLEAVENLSRAAALGDAFALYRVSCFYMMGEGVERDEKLGIYYLEESALAGSNAARYALGLVEELNYNFDRAVKHWIIGTNCGHDDSLDRLKNCYKEGRISKEDYASALRTHQAAVNATKSPQREAAKDMFVIPFDTFDMICKQMMRMGGK